MPTDPAAYREAQGFLRIALAAMTAFYVLAAVMTLLFGPWEGASVTTVLYGLPFLIASALGYWNARAEYRYASPGLTLVTLITLISISVAFFLHLYGSTSTPIAAGFIILIIMATILGSPWTGGLATVTTTASYGAVLLAEQWGLVPYAPLFPQKEAVFEIPGMARSMFLAMAFNNTFSFALANYIGVLLRRLRRQAEAGQEAALDLAQRKDEFMANVSHELRSPLTTVIGYAEYLKSRKGRLSPDDIDHYTDLMLNDAKRLQRVINDIIDFQTMVKGRLVYNFAETDIPQVLHDAVTHLPPQLSHAAIDLDVSAGGDLPPIPADSTRLEEAFINLLTNAIKFSPKDGKVRVRVQKTADDTPPPLPRRNAATHGRASDAPLLIHADGVWVSISDEGRGIPEDKLDDVFGEFVQVPGDTGGKNQGIGLGLPITREIVEGHHGRVWVDSALGEGSTFHVWLPAHPPSEGAVRQ